MSVLVSPADVRPGMRVEHPNGFILTIDSAGVHSGFVRLVGRHEPEPGVTEWVAWYPAADLPLEEEP